MRELSSLSHYDLAGVDISLYQRYIDIAGIAQEYPLIVLKATEGATITDPYFLHYESHTRDVPYRGFYHFCTWADPTAQAQRFIEAVRPYVGPGDFLVIDWESVKNVGQVPREIAYEIHRQVCEAFPGVSVWWYTYRSIAFRERDTYGSPLWPLWLASFDVIEDSYELGAIIDQYGVADSLLPWYSGSIDVNRILDPGALHALVYPAAPEDIEVEATSAVNIKSHDADGNPTSVYVTQLQGALEFTHTRATQAAIRSERALAAANAAVVAANAAVAAANAAAAGAAAANTKLDSVLAKIDALQVQGGVTLDMAALADAVADVIAERLAS